MTDQRLPYHEIRCASLDRERHYIVRTSIPAGEPPAAGYPVLCMLDGDWTRPALATPETGASAAPAIVVSIGYGDDEELGKAARAYDYTPQILPGRIEFDPRVPRWKSGGADAFLDLLQSRLLPAALKGSNADMTRMTLFGHSYGGLCALYDLLTRPRSFTHYAIASPSLWWRDGFLLAAALSASVPGDTSSLRKLLVMAGEREQWHPLSVGPDGSPQSRTGGISTLPAMRQLVQTIQSRGLAKAELSVFPDLGHGGMLRASVKHALRFCIDSKV